MTFRLPNAKRPKVSAPEGGGIEIARMRRRHVRAVLAIEERVFPRPWSLALYLSELAQPDSRLYSVALANEEVPGVSRWRRVLRRVEVGLFSSHRHHRGVGRSRRR